MNDILNETFFDSCDTYYLANTFGIHQLRYEIKQSEIKQAVDNALRTDDWPAYAPFPYGDYIACCKDAIRWQRDNVKQTVTPLPYHIDVDALKARLDIVAEVERHTELRRFGNRFTGCCPLHGEKHPSFIVYPDTQTWHCFGYNRGGDVISFIMLVEDVDFKGAVNNLAGVAI